MFYILLRLKTCYGPIYTPSCSRPSEHLSITLERFLSTSLSAYRSYNYRSSSYNDRRPDQSSSVSL